jgi:phosphohistidine phosphatase
MVFMAHLTRVILMRHAKSDWFSGVGDDFLRPLNERGVRDARHMGQWLVATGHLPRLVFSSPSTRTRETLARLSEGAQAELEPQTEWRETLYHASADALAALVWHERARAPFMVLAHNPGLENLVAYLVGERAFTQRHGKSFPTAAVYVLDVDTSGEGLTRGLARVIAHERPKGLPD